MDLRDASASKNMIHRQMQTSLIARNEVEQHIYSFLFWGWFLYKDLVYQFSPKFLNIYSSSSSPSSSSSSYSSSPSSPSSSAWSSSLSNSNISSSASTASSSSGVSGSLPFFPGLSPYHLGSLAAWKRVKI